ncbi:MAG: hypothetical protein CO106_11095 [Deltaproteobacteria bacterium CG_4_9_14_3_um_filter_44_9]|nr:MAG: hypothetical protein CO106_11095 [Deltaproteobacteria bacterium CG_4_9_14_3_um_filter_44_9]
MEKRHPLDNLIQHAINLGVSDAKIVSVEEISVEDHLAKMCEEPQCDGYGQTINCPPHVMKPDRFREYIGQYKLALVFKLDVPTEILLTDERNDVTRIIHETAASIEQFAIDDGHANSKGLAAGSCKRIFCSGYDECRVLNEGGDCRFPNLARPSLSGLGINFFKLSKALGWQINKITKNSNPDDVPMGMMAGIVLIGEGDLRQ